jgi:hypothetical protein
VNVLRAENPNIFWEDFTCIFNKNGWRKIGHLTDRELNVAGFSNISIKYVKVLGLSRQSCALTQMHQVPVKWKMKSKQVLIVPPL